MQSPTPAAILETAENLRGAQVFVDFLLSEQGQIIFGNVEVRIAARPGVNTRFTFDDLVPAGADVFQYPTQDVFDNIDDWTARFRAIAGI
jgi:ABC-type Fe3+ transport system substrate-binding protein